MKKTKNKKFNSPKLTTPQNFSDSLISQLSKNKTARHLYLKNALENYGQDKDLPNLLLAIRAAIIASGGIQDLAIKTNLNRQTLYKALSPKGNPSFALVDLIVNALGMKLTLHRKAA